MTSHGGVYSQFRRALEGRSFMQAWTLAGEPPKVPLADGLALLLLARDVEPARFDRSVPGGTLGFAPSSSSRPRRRNSRSPR